MTRPVLSVETGLPLGITPPHCDQRILHLPADCTFCASATVLQAERELLGVSNSGVSNRTWACPADLARSPAAYHAWAGNRPKP